MNKKLTIFILLSFFIAGLFFRLYHIEFGLPHSFYADEPEIAELAIKYTYEFRDIVKNNDYHKFIPISFVYGSFPSYLNTVATMAFSKTSNLLGISFDKTDVYVFMRSFNALISLIIIFSTSLLTHKLFNNKTATLSAFFLVSLNWKFIVHAHYINADVTQTILLSISYLSLFYYYKSNSDTKFTLITGVLYGLAAATKITTLITLPFYWYLFLYKKDYRSLTAFSFIAFGAFIIGSPFSMILANTFAFRILTMLTKEGGMVLDSANHSPLKYITALISILTPLIVSVSLYGKYKLVKKISKETVLKYHVFLLANVFVYIIFFSLQSRLIERWLLPIVPIVMIYAAYGYSELIKVLKSKIVIFSISIVIATTYLYYPTLLLKQFDRYTPKSEAYLWLKDNTSITDKVLAYTEEGLDPINKLPNSKVYKVEVYSGEAAQFFMPEDPFYYDYVVLSSRPMSNYKNPVVSKEYPFYYEKWNAFEETLLNEDEFVLVKEFVLPKPNLIPLSDVFIYKNLEPALVRQETL